MRRMNSQSNLERVKFTGGPHALRLRRMGIDTYQEPIIYMREDCAVCRSEGFAARSRVRIATEHTSLVATVNVVQGDGLLGEHEAGLSEVAWRRLEATEGAMVMLSHPEPLRSFGYVRAKLYGQRLDGAQLGEIVGDIAMNRYTDVQLSAFISACTEDRLDLDEVVALTEAMVGTGERLQWDFPQVMDKHCVGGLPGNRTTPIIVAIVAACGLPIPKTSSRAITSPAGTADAMETLAPVDLDLTAMRRVVEQEGGCVVWGGAVDLAPADDVLIRVERALDIDSDAQLVASVLSKKIAAGATHVVIDVPVGPTAKVRGDGAAADLTRHLTAVARRLGLPIAVEITDGSQPVGHGIGPALEARDVLAVLRGHHLAPRDLRARALKLAARIIEIARGVDSERSLQEATEILADGRAWQKFQAICEAQGGMREPPAARYVQAVEAADHGSVVAIDNRRLARVAKLAGAPNAPAAGVDLHFRLGERVSKGDTLFDIHAESPGELAYALDYLANQPVIVSVGDLEGL